MFSFYDMMIKSTLVPLLLRLALATVFVFHGLDMIRQEWGGAWNPSLPWIQQMAVAWGELLGGVAMAIGFMTRLAALGLAVIMGGAIALAHWDNGFDIQVKGYEYNFVLIVLCLALIIGGPGPVAVDRIWRFRRKKK
jgi:putative oxidoreductase